ncbi:RNA polymerase sigma factor [Sanyastnella coralliicola]|uniref:RNA polymerase sigma factor n=1 Tax=Sanyastnella coralliicola TaxID=3069118 RepID=UPI0027B9B1AB|nr:sigma-70 family RNA polymerase sigma factor [Longitalea sp. SCSIO 12813]
MDLISKEEVEIKKLLKAPDQQKKAFEMMVRVYKEMVYFHVRRMVLDHDDADDVTQNVFIKAWKGLKNFRGDSKVSTWLYRIATNESITFLQKAKKLAGVPFDELEYKLSDSLQADVYYDGDEIQRKLEVALAQLPEKQKAVFIMRYYDEMPYKEISEVTGTSVGALKASYHHAVTKLEKILTEEN